jgi:hypothetical protein
LDVIEPSPSNPRSHSNKFQDAELMAKHLDAWNSHAALWAGRSGIRASCRYVRRLSETNWLESVLVYRHAAQHVYRSELFRKKLLASSATAIRHLPKFTGSMSKLSGTRRKTPEDQVELQEVVDRRTQCCGSISRNFASQPTTIMNSKGAVYV